jgi:predicted transcriptional regulator
VDVWRRRTGPADNDDARIVLTDREGRVRFTHAGAPDAAAWTAFTAAADALR